MPWTPDPDALRGKVAVVAGATRGAGRGIATALGEAGATVVCTGRSSVTGRDQSDYDRPETIEETADLVPDQVQRLAERLRDEYGAIHVLVNDIWGAELLKGGPAVWGTPLWELDL